MRVFRMIVTTATTKICLIPIMSLRTVIRRMRMRILIDGLTRELKDMARKETEITLFVPSTTRSSDWGDVKRASCVKVKRSGELNEEKRKKEEKRGIKFVLFVLFVLLVLEERCGELNDREKERERLLNLNFSFRALYKYTHSRIFASILKITHSFCQSIYPLFQLY